jgi:hypothetical protein
MFVYTGSYISESSSPIALKFWHNFAFEYARVFIYLYYIDVTWTACNEYYILTQH